MWFRLSDARVHFGLDIFEAADGSLLPSALSCADCPGVSLLRRHFRQQHSLAIDLCPKCHGLWLDVRELPLLRGLVLPPGRVQSGPPNEAIETTEPAIGRMGMVGEALALPAAFLIAATLRFIPPLAFLFGYSRLLLHELGHALTAWTFGRAAIPLPIGFTVSAQDRSFGALALVALACAGLISWGLKTHRFFVMGVGAAWGMFTLIATFSVHPALAERWIVFGGAAGEIVLSALLVGAFPHHLPHRLRWDFWRFVALVVGAYVFLSAWLTWSSARFDSSAIPWGSLLGEPADGDMDRLREGFDWSPARIAATYFAWCRAALIAILMSFALGWVSCFTKVDRTFVKKSL